MGHAASGLVYGAILVLSILMATGGHAPPPFETAAILFGSILAVTLAKAFAELLSHALDKGERIGPGAWRNAWRHSSPTLAVANLPTLFFVAAGLGWLTADGALGLSQLVCIAVLLVVGGRIGWVIDGRAGRAVLGAIFAGSVGAALALLKYIIH